MGRFHNRQFPGESTAYRTARDELLTAEMELRRRYEAVAAQRRALPLGGRAADYVFDEDTAVLGAAPNIVQTPLAALFAPGKTSLFIYSFMFAPDHDTACPACTSLLDALDGGALYIQDRINFAVVAKAPIEKIRAWAAGRGWRNLRLLSSNGNTYNADYGAEDGDGGQLPALNVFTKTDEGIFHTYNAELLYGPSEPDQHPRHADFIWPLWNIFDLTPEGRGDDWFPRYAYE